MILLDKELVLSESEKLSLDAKFEAMNAKFDEAEAMIAKGGHVRGEPGSEYVFPTTHRFTPGMYIREIFMPAGSLLTSEIHLTEHPFVISYGQITVWNPHTGTELFQAPHTGITLPGTRRILFCHTDVIWTTFHALTKLGFTDEEIRDMDEKTLVDKIESVILFKRRNPLIEDRKEMAI